LEIIPAIDLMQGLVVHARQGCRASYQPISTALCQNADPNAVIDALLSLYPFKTLYIADLDALMHRGSNRALIDRLTRTYPDLKFWVDQGLTGGTIVLPEQRNWVAVIGSESLEADTVPLLAQSRHQIILSLDYSASRLLGPRSLVEQSAIWPEKIIIMNLSRVGTNEGPELLQLERFIHQCPEKSFVSAGGVRGERDLVQLDSAGVSAALVTTALHNGQLNAAVVSRFNVNRCGIRPATVTPNKPE
jgi:phosphoribosylformimino-5-aminoimidazole carboxamide ribotide isomerase